MFRSIVHGPPYDLVLEPNDEGGCSISVPIAEDDLNRVVFVETTLTPVNIDGFEHHELVFQIVIIALDDSFEAMITQLREVAKAYIPSEAKPHIMPIVCASCIKLLENAKPELIYAVTKDTFLPPPALVKYEQLTAVVQRCGYVIYEIGTDSWGRDFWKWSGSFRPPELAQPTDPSQASN